MCKNSQINIFLKQIKYMILLVNDKKKLKRGKNNNKHKTQINFKENGKICLMNVSKKVKICLMNNKILYTVLTFSKNIFQSSYYYHFTKMKKKAEMISQ